MRVAPYFDILLPYPPSLNSAWRCLGTKVVLAKRQRVYRRVVRDKVLQVLADRDTPYSVLGVRAFVAEITLYPPTRRKYDLDNLAKPVLDALMACGVFEDDSQCAILVLNKSTINPPTGSCWVTLTAHPHTLGEIQG